MPTPSLIGTVNSERSRIPSELATRVPDFAIAQRSASESLAIVREKRQEDLANKMQLGDLLDPLFDP